MKIFIIEVAWFWAESLWPPCRKFENHVSSFILFCYIKVWLYLRDEMNIVATCLKRLACLYIVTFGDVSLQGSSLLAVNYGGLIGGSPPPITHILTSPCHCHTRKSKLFPWVLIGNIILSNITQHSPASSMNYSFITCFSRQALFPSVSRKIQDWLP